MATDRNRDDDVDQPAEDIIERPDNQATMEVQEWQLTTPVAESHGEIFVPLRVLCAMLGIASDMQARRIKGHPVIAPSLRRFQLKTKKGLQPTYCLSTEVIGFWLGTISINKVRAEVRPELLRFQLALVKAARELLRQHTLGSATALTIVEGGGTNKRLRDLEGFAAMTHERLSGVEREIADLRRAIEEGTIDE